MNEWIITSKKESLSMFGLIWIYPESLLTAMHYMCIYKYIYIYIYCRTAVSGFHKITILTFQRHDKFKMKFYVQLFYNIYIGRKNITISRLFQSSKRIVPNFSHSLCSKLFHLASFQQNVLDSNLSPSTAQARSFQSCFRYWTRAAIWCGAGELNHYPTGHPDL